MEKREILSKIIELLFLFQAIITLVIWFPFSMGAMLGIDKALNQSTLYFIVYLVLWSNPVFHILLWQLIKQSKNLFLNFMVLPAPALLLYFSIIIIDTGRGFSAGPM